MNRAVVLLLLILSLSACGRPAETAQSTPPAQPPASTPAIAGNASAGKELIARHGCTVCHVIPGFDGGGMLGPSLAGLATRPTIGNGAIPNSPSNVAKYIESPQSLNPQSMMPPLGLPTADTQAIAAYLLK